MSRGRPDYSEYTELVTRLGSISSLDCQGDAVFLEDFSEGSLRWWITPPGGGSSVDIVSDRYRSKGYSCKMITANDGTGSVEIYKYFPVPIYSGIGLEVSFCISGLLGTLQFYVRLQTAASFRQFTAMYNVQTGLLQIFRDGFAAVNCNLPETLYADTHLWHTLKMVGDYKTNKYMRLLLDNFYIDLSAYNCYTFTPGGSPYLQVTLTAFPDPVANRDYWLDDIILTQSEV